MTELVSNARPPRVRSLSAATLRDGVSQLIAVDPFLAAIIARRGMPPLWARRQGFATLIRIILEQQVSLAAAATLYRRLVVHAGGMTPDAIAALGVDGLRAFGLTRQKSAFCYGLAVQVRDGVLVLSAVARENDAHARAMLLGVPGLGPWSVDIYFLMALRRPDVWPQGDLALAVAIRDGLGLSALPSRVEQARMAERWRPWRSVAARIVWLEYLATRNRL